MHSFLQLAQERFSCRHFSQEPVTKDELQQILQAACLAPSAVNSQSCQLYVVQDSEKLQKLAKLRNWFGATALIVVCLPEQASWERMADGQNFALVDVGILVDHMSLCATELGLGSCIIGSFAPEQVRSCLQIANNLYPMAVLALGHKDSESKPAPAHNQRKSITERIIAGSDF